MLLFKDEKRHYFFKLQKDGDGWTIALSTPDRTLASARTAGRFFDLKVVSYGTSFAFWYAPDGKGWTLLKDNVPADYLSTAEAGGFTGTTIGLYATK